MPLHFSIITVCFNSRTALPAAVNSLAAQTYPHREWVVVDGGSTDGTQDYVRHHAPEPLGPFVSESDRGIYDAMNKGIRMATGDLLFFLNSDDALHDPQVLADVAQAFEADPTLELLWGDVVVRQGETHILKRYGHINRWTIGFEDLCHQGIFARQSLFDRLGDFRLQWRTSADYDWVMRAFRSGSRMRYTPRAMALFTAGGAHVQNPQALAEERRELRLQYLSPLTLSLGTFLSRAAHKLSRIATGHVIGESLVQPEPPR